MTVRQQMLGGAAARGVMVNGCPVARPVAKLRELAMGYDRSTAMTTEQAYAAIASYRKSYPGITHTARTLFAGVDA